MRALNLKRSDPIINCNAEMRPAHRRPIRYVPDQDSESSDEDMPVLARVNEYEPALIPIAPVMPIDEPYDEADEFLSTEIFWKIIATFDWSNTSNGHPNVNDVVNKVNKLQPNMKKLFTNHYQQKYQMLHDKLAHDGMFERTGLRTRQDQAKVVSHAIALGHDQFETLFDDFEIFQFLIEANECLSLNAILPMDIAM